jgi:hypothetical protein
MRKDGYKIVFIDGIIIFKNSGVFLVFVVYGDHQRVVIVLDIDPLAAGSDNSFDNWLVQRAGLVKHNDIAALGSIKNIGNQQNLSVIKRIFHRFAIYRTNACGKTKQKKNKADRNKKSLGLIKYFC